MKKYAVVVVSETIDNIRLAIVEAANEVDAVKAHPWFTNSQALPDTLVEIKYCLRKCNDRVEVKEIK